MIPMDKTASFYYCVIALFKVVVQILLKHAANHKEKLEMRKLKTFAEEFARVTGASQSVVW